MAFSKTAIAKAEAEALSQFGVECRYHPSVSTWYKVVGGVVTPFDLRNSADRSMRDRCRQALLQADYDEQIAKKNASGAGAGNGAGAGFDGFWATLLGDDDVRKAAHRVFPKPFKPFVNPFLDALDGLFGSGASSAGGAGGASGATGMSAATAAIAKSGIAGAGGFLLGQASGNSGIGGAVGGAIGMALGGPVGAAIGAALVSGLETVLVGAIKRTISNVARSHDLGSEAADSFSRGALSLSQNALDAGQHIGNTLLEGVLRPFGVSGTAVSQFSAQLGSSLSRTVMASLSVGAQGLRIAGGAAGLGIGLGGAALGGAAGFAVSGGGLGLLLHNPGMMLTGVMGAILPALIGSMVGLIAVKAISVISGVIGSVLDKLGQAFGELGRLGGSALKGIIDVLGDIKRTALEVSQAVLSMSQNSGLSVSASSTAVNNLMGLGIAPNQSSQIFGRNILEQQVMDAAMGFRGAPGSTQYLLSVQNQYQLWKQQFGGNPLMANQMMQAAGKADLIPMANLPRQELLKSLEFSRGLEMPSGASEVFGQKIGMLENRVGQFASYIKTQLAIAFAPSFERGLTVATDFFKSHQREIVEGIRDIGRWFYQLPSYAVDAAIVIIGGLGGISKGIAGMLKDFKDAKGPIFDFVFGFLNGIDRLITGVYKFTHGVQSMVEYAKVAAGITLHPLDVRGNMEALVKANRFANTAPPQSHLATDFKDFAQNQTITEKIARPFQSFGKWSDQTLPTLREWQRDRFNREKMGRDYDGIMSQMSLPENENTPSVRRSFVEKQQMNSNEWFTNERTSEENERTSVFKEQKNRLARAVEHYSRQYRESATGEKSLQSPERQNPLEAILQLLRALLESNSKGENRKVHVTVGLQPHEKFIGEILAIEQWEDYEMLGGRVAGSG